MRYLLLCGSRFFVSLFIGTSLAVMPCVSIAGSPSIDPVDRTTLSSDQRAVQAISRLTFGARPGEFDRVKKMGVDAFIAEQLNPDLIDDSALFKRLEKLPTLNQSTPTLAEQYNPPKPPPTPTSSPSPAMSPKPADPKAPVAADVPNPTMNPEVKPQPEAKPSPSPTPKPAPTPVPKNPQMVLTELQRAKLLRAVYSQRQLSEVMVDFWENHFSIYGNKDATRWMLTAFDREAIRPYAMTRFRDLLGATAHSPAMLFYLDNWQSSVLREYPATKDKPARKSGGINENYARELMELHTLGVDGGYTQKDVQEVARCFTGWGIRKPNEEGLFVYNPNAHDNGEKTVLGVRIPAGGGISDGERVLDILAKSSSTARFIATKMARRFLGDNPPANVIDKAAKTFLATDGSITETLRSIITSPAFSTTANYRTKVKTPFEYVASALRATDAETDADRPILDWISRMGQPVYGRVTPDGYPDMSGEWLSNNDLLARFNFATALTLNNIKGTTVNPAKMITSGSDLIRSADEMARSIIIGDVSENTRAALEKLAANLSRPNPPAVTTPSGASRLVAPPATNNAAKVAGEQLLALILGAPEFQHK
jgi:uncharacterized protein (DUF1800 family)